MGIEFLEEKYERYAERHPSRLAVLRSLADRAAQAQLEMRALFDPITPVLCTGCASPCCRCMPVEGWFTEGDYFLYRTRHEAPFELRQAHVDGRSCAFLGPAGCVLPADLRPFPCVKVNCARVSEELAKRGCSEAFGRLYNELESVQDELWRLLSDIYSENAVQAQSL